MSAFLTWIRQYQSNRTDAVIACSMVWALLLWLRAHRERVRTTRLRGPPSESFLYGVGMRIRSSKDPGALYEVWAQDYGPVYCVPSILRGERIILCDPKAISHFHSKETTTYIQTPLTKESFGSLYGKGLLWAHGDDHKRQRKSLLSAFSVPAVRKFVPVFYESAYKTKGAWDALIGSNDGNPTLIEVQSWMNHLSLDNVGLACFSHNFGALEGKRSAVIEVLDTFSASPRATALNKSLLLLAQIFPILARIPTSRSRLVKKLNIAMVEMLNVLLERARKEIEAGGAESKEEKSVIGILIKGANENSEFRLTQEEVMAQMKVLLVAGYETTSITLSWALLELSRHPDVQTKLRDELLKHDGDPTYDQFTSCLPYLDAVVHEVLRIHSPILELTRIADENDVIPLSEPIHTKGRELVNSLTIAKGTFITVPMECMNRSAAIWGNDAKVFRPNRWLKDAQGRDGIPAKAREIHGHRHLLSFVDGPRACIGKNFALAELKVVLTVLIKNFIFELRDGIDTKIDVGRGVFPRPKVAGEVGCKLPLRVRRHAS